MSDMHLAPFSPSLGSALVKALSASDMQRIDSPYLGTDQSRGRPRRRRPVPPTDNQSMYDRIDAMNPRGNMPTGQREFELGNRVSGSLGASNRLIQERNRSPISNISRDVGSAARRGMDRAASSLTPMADAARQRFSDAGQSMRQGAQVAGQAMNRGAMNVASKIPGMARAAGRMVETAGRKVGEAAETARERMTSPEAKKFAATTREGAGAMMGAAGRGAMAAGRTARKVAGAAAGAGMEYGAKGTRALGRGAMNVASRLPGMATAAGRFMMGTNNQMANQPLATQTSQSGNESEGKGEGEEQPQQAAPSGYTPSQGMLDNLYQQNLDRAQTRGGIGTGVMSNLLTGGLSGLARGAYNMRQRNLARQNLQNLGQRGAAAVPFLRSEYETMIDRSIIRSKMTTEAIRNAYVF